MADAARIVGKCRQLAAQEIERPLVDDFADLLIHFILDHTPHKFGFIHHHRIQEHQNLAQVMSDIEGSIIWSCAQSPSIIRLQCWRYEPENGFTRTQTLATDQQSESPHFMKFISLPPAK